MKKMTQCKFCKINEFVCVHDHFFRLYKRTETNSVLLAEKFGKNDNKEK